MRVDYHIHTKLCGHAYGEMEEYVEEALRKGLNEIGFSDHIPMYFLPPEERDASIAMQESDLPIYVENVMKIREKYKPFPVKLGIEADFSPCQENKLINLIEPYDFDYVLGSVHFINEWGFDNAMFISEYDKWDLYELYERYFSLISQAAQSGLFDIMSHPDLIKKFGYRPDCDLTSLYERTAKTIADAGVCVELNTAGLRVPAVEVYPSQSFLGILCRYGVGVTLGSDAHSPEQVGENFALAVQILKEVGYDKIVTFNKRRKKYHNI